MTSIRERPRIAGAENALAAEVEVLFAEARKRGRRRRFAIALVLAVVFALIASAVAVFASTAGSAHTRVSAVRSGGVSAPVGAPTMVAYDGGVGKQRGGLKVVDTKTGKTIRTLVRNPPNVTINVPLWSIELGLEITNDGKTVYFVEDDRGAANPQFELKSVSTVGGKVRDLARGTQPEISPDGSLLAYQPDGPTSNMYGSDSTSGVIALMDVRTGVTRTVRVPGLGANQSYSVTWLPDSRRLVVHSSDLVNRRPADPVRVPSTGIPKDPRLGAETLLLDSSSLRFTRLPEVTTQALEQGFHYAITIEGPGARGDLLRVATGSPASYTGLLNRIGTIDVMTGRIHWSAELPPKTYLGNGLVVLSGQDSWTHVIVAAPHGGAPAEWSPAAGDRVSPVGPPGGFSFRGLAAYA